MPSPNLKQFYIPEEQSIYLLSHDDAQKLTDWIVLCKQQLEQSGFYDIELIGNGAFGFVFAGKKSDQEEYVFKFSRINLSQKIQDRLEEEAFMLDKVNHPLVPKLVEFIRINNQAILIMERVKGENLEEICLKYGNLPARLIVKIGAQLSEIISFLREIKKNNHPAPIVHGDIKPSNVMFDPETEKIGLIDWGSSVFAQLDGNRQAIGRGVMELLSDDIQQTNARLGDVYFIGLEQMEGALSTTRFDEQGIAGTLYALASGQSCRFGFQTIPPSSLGLPKELALTLDAMLGDDPAKRDLSGEYFMNNMKYMKQIVFRKRKVETISPVLPVWVREFHGKMDTVVYTSRKSFLKEGDETLTIQDVDNVELDKYYRNFMVGMGDKEKAFLAAVSRLGKYAVVGGLAIKWTVKGVYIDSNLNLFDQDLKSSFFRSINNMVTLACSIKRIGIFKSCLFKARDTLHLYRKQRDRPFQPLEGMAIPFEISSAPKPDDKSKLHSYFEDGDDPDELLNLPDSIINIVEHLNTIHHTGCIIFEALATHLKIHSYYVLLNPQREKEFSNCLKNILKLIPEIKGQGISGYMKLPYKDTRFFPFISSLPPDYYPRNPVDSF